METLVGPLAEKIYKALEPRVTDIVSRASQAAEPTIRAVVREEILPRVGLVTVIGLAAMGAVAAAIGSYFATRR